MDPVSNMLISIKNGNRALKESVIVPQSQLCLAIAEKLSKIGFIGAIEQKSRKGRPVMEITLISKDRIPKVNEIVRISKPSRRMYFGVHDIKMIKNGSGAMVFSTPKGILTDKEARKENVGGEALFSIW
jgi:small subunit ribosomal protein S8